MKRTAQRLALSAVLLMAAGCSKNRQPRTLDEYKARTVKRVAWAEQKVQSLGRVDAVLFFNEFDRTADVNDYIFAYVCNDGKNDHFVLANKKRKILFNDFYDNPNHVIMRAAYREHPEGVWVKYDNPLIQGQKKYAYVKVLPEYRLCIGSGFSFDAEM